MASSLRIGVLVDRSVEYRRFITEPASTQVSTKWGDTTQHATPVGWRYKRPLGPEHQWLNDQVACLPTIGRLAQERTVKLYTSPELRWEGCTAAPNITYGNRGDFFGGADVGSVPAAVDRSYFRSVPSRQAVDRDAVKAFCQFLLDVDIGAIRGEPLIWDRLSPAMQANLENIDRFRFLCKKASKSHFPDVLHFWTAETHNLAFS